MYSKSMPLWLAISCLVCSNFASGEDLLLGASAVKITPPLGSAMAGYFHNRGAEAVHDDLYAKALVFQKDGVRVALVVCDLIAIPRAVTEQVRAIAARDLGLPGSNIMISATHAHTGPVMASEADAYNLPAEMRKIASAYSQLLPGKIVESIRLAVQNMRSAKVSTAAGAENTLSFNRRFFMKDGTVGWNPGKKNPSIKRRGMGEGYQRKVWQA